MFELLKLKVTWMFYTVVLVSCWVKMWILSCLLAPGSARSMWKLSKTLCYGSGGKGRNCAKFKFWVSGKTKTTVTKNTKSREKVQETILISHIGSALEQEKQHAHRVAAVASMTERPSLNKWTAKHGESIIASWYSIDLDLDCTIGCHEPLKTTICIT